MSAKTDGRRADAASAPRPPFEMGDLGRWVGQQKYSLRWCPLCARDPDRQPHRFGDEKGRSRHFHEEHDADEIGRPLHELVASGYGGEP